MIETLLAAALALSAALAAGWVSEQLHLALTVALAAIFYPAAESLVGFVDVARLVGQPTTLKALTPAQLARLPWNILEDTLVVPLAGLGIAAALGARREAWAYLSPFARRARAWVPELSVGWAAIPVIVGAEAGALALLEGPASFLQTADESALFANATLVHVVLLSLTPAFVEELYYRNLLQGALEQLWPGKHAVWAALGIQAVVFGLAHGGYTSIAHILGPLVFGLGMGLLRTVAGLGACMVGHAGVNLFYFAIDPGAGSPVLLASVAVLTVVGLVVLGVLWPTIRARFRAGPKPVLGTEP